MSGVSFTPSKRKATKKSTPRSRAAKRSRRLPETFDEGQVVYVKGHGTFEYFILLIDDEQNNAIVMSMWYKPSVKMYDENTAKILREGMRAAQIVPVSHLSPVR